MTTIIASTLVSQVLLLTASIMDPQTHEYNFRTYLCYQDSTVIPTAFMLRNSLHSSCNGNGINLKMLQHAF
jgi:hypothetical protein